MVSGSAEAGIALVALGLVLGLVLGGLAVKVALTPRAVAG